MHRGMFATAVKGVFKIYLVPAMRTQDALATITGGWRDLVAEARQEQEDRKQGDVLVEPQPYAEPVIAKPLSTTPVAEPGEQRRSSPRLPITPREESDPRADHPGQDDAAVGLDHAMEQSPSTPELVSAEDPETAPTPTLVEAGESGVEVRPNPAISPVHATAGVIAHLPPEVCHKLAGNGPIRA